MSDPYYCAVCRLPCSGPESYAQHCAGKRHRRMVRRSQMYPESVEPNHLNLNLPKDGTIAYVSAPKYYCDLCRTECSSPENFDEHCRGRRHLRALQRQKRFAARKKQRERQKQKKKTDRQQQQQWETASTSTTSTVSSTPSNASDFGYDPHQHQHQWESGASASASSVGTQGSSTTSSVGGSEFDVDQSSEVADMTPDSDSFSDTRSTVSSAPSDGSSVGYEPQQQQQRQQQQRRSGGVRGAARGGDGRGGVSPAGIGTTGSFGLPPLSIGEDPSSSSSSGPKSSKPTTTTPQFLGQVGVLTEERGSKPKDSVGIGGGDSTSPTPLFLASAFQDVSVSPSFMVGEGEGLDLTDPAALASASSSLSTPSAPDQPDPVLRELRKRRKPRAEDPSTPTPTPTSPPPRLLSSSETTAILNRVIRAHQSKIEEKSDEVLRLRQELQRQKEQQQQQQQQEVVELRRLVRAYKARLLQKEEEFRLLQEKMVNVGGGGPTVESVSSLRAQVREMKDMMKKKDRQIRNLKAENAMLSLRVSETYGGGAKKPRVRRF